MKQQQTLLTRTELSPEEQTKASQQHVDNLRALLELDKGEQQEIFAQLRGFDRTQLVHSALSAGSNANAFATLQMFLACVDSSADAPLPFLRGRKRIFPGLYQALQSALRAYFGLELSSARLAMVRCIAENGRGRRVKSTGTIGLRNSKKRLLATIMPQLIGDNDENIAQLLEAVLGPNLAIDRDWLREAMKPDSNYIRDAKDQRWVLAQEHIDRWRATGEFGVKPGRAMSLERRVAEVCSAIGISQCKRGDRACLNDEAKMIKKLINE